MGRLPEQVDLLQAGWRRGVVGSAHHAVQHPLQALHKLLRQLVLRGRSAVQLLQLGWGTAGHHGVNPLYYIYIEGVQADAVVQSDHNKYICKKKEKQQYITVGKVMMFLEISAKN